MQTQRTESKQSIDAKAARQAKSYGFTGNFCTQCGSPAMVRTGTCETCQVCFSTSGGCS